MGRREREGGGGHRHGVADFHLHLLLGGSVSMSDDGDDAAQLHPKEDQSSSRGQPGAGRHADDQLLRLTWSLKLWERWGCLLPRSGWTRGYETEEPARASQCFCKSPKTHITKRVRSEPQEEEELKLAPQDLGTVVVVLHGVLHEAETVHVAHVRVSVSPEEVEAAHGLLQE